MVMGVLRKKVKRDGVDTGRKETQRPQKQQRWIDLEMISPWIIWVVPKSNDTCPMTSVLLRDTQRGGEGHVKTGAETGAMQPTANRIWRRKERGLPQPLGCAALQTR